MMLSFNMASGDAGADGADPGDLAFQHVALD
jgi:hypothetical protein